MPHSSRKVEFTNKSRVATMKEKAGASSSKPKTTNNPSPNTSKEDTNMAQNPTPRPAATPNQNKPTNGATPPADGKTAAPAKVKSKRIRVRWVSEQIPGFWVRSYQDVTDKHGAPLDPKGNKMVAKAGVPFGTRTSDPAAKAEREAAKAAEAARYAALSDEQKVAEAKTKREAKQVAKAAKALQERKELEAQIRAEIAAGKL